MIYHRNQGNDPSDVSFSKSLMNFVCQPCRTFEGISHHQEDKIIAPTAFADSVGLGYRIKKLVSSKFMGMVR